MIEQMNLMAGAEVIEVLTDRVACDVGELVIAGPAGRDRPHG